MNSPLEAGKRALAASVTLILCITSSVQAQEFITGALSALTGAVPVREIYADVPADAIPPLNTPEFISARDAFVGDGDLVAGVALNGDAFAYPLKIMNYHEIVHHVVGGLDVVTTYCPLTNSAVLFDAADLAFGNTGALYNNNVVMYDRETRSVWSQMALGCIFGDRAGEHLTVLPVAQATWEAWRALYPDTRLLSNKTGFERGRNYDYDPWIESGYTENNAVWFPQTPAIDQRLPAKEMVFGLTGRDGAIAYSYGDLELQLAVNQVFGGEEIVIFCAPKGRLALGYSRRLGERVLHFAPVEATGDDLLPQFRDAETGSLWSMLGEAVDGSLEGTKLMPIATYSAYWFAWASFWQNTEVWDGENLGGTAVANEGWGEIKAYRLTERPLR